MVFCKWCLETKCLLEGLWTQILEVVWEESDIICPLGLFSVVTEDGATHGDSATL